MKANFFNMKIVGRGQAVRLTEQLVDILRSKMSNLDYKHTYLEALNKAGEVVEELHILVSKRAVKFEKPAADKFRD